MKSPKRFESIVPLSREHHYALLICLSINRGLLQRPDDKDWIIRKADNVVKFYQCELVTHFKAEEEILFPVIKQLHFNTFALNQYIDEHRGLENIILQLKSIDKLTQENLKEFARILEGHIRKEERELFPFYQEHVDPEMDREVQNNIRSYIGDASKPRYRELFDE